MSGKDASSRDASYFAALYNADPDPWNFVGSAYEHEKYQATIAALGGQRFGSAFEIGCSIGVLTRLLAPRCGKLLAVDIVERALVGARKRCADLANISFVNLRVPDQWPIAQNFDLILCSEMLYFLSPADTVRTADLAVASLNAGGVVLLVNYTEPVDEPCGGDQAAEIFIAAARDALVPTFQERQEKFRIDLLRRRGEVHD